MIGCHLINVEATIKLKNKYHTSFITTDSSKNHQWMMLKLLVKSLMVSKIFTVSEYAPMGYLL